MNRSELSWIKSKTFLEQAEKSRLRWIKEKNPNLANQAELSLLSAVSLLKVDHKNSEELPKALFSLGEILQTINRPAEALKAYEECLTFVKNEELKAKTLVNMSEVHILSGKFGDSFKSFEEAQKSLKNVTSFPNKVVEAALIANNAIALFAGGKKEEALSQGKKAAYLFAQELGFSHSKTKEALQNVITIIRSGGEDTSKELSDFKNEWKNKMNEEIKKYEDLGEKQSKGKSFDDAEKLWSKQNNEEFNPSGFFLPPSVAKLELEEFQKSTKNPLHIQVS